MSEGSLNSFEAAFESHFEQVYGYVAYRLAPALDDANDLTQEIFLAALGAWHSFRGEASALTWLRSIARRKIADHFANQNRVGRGGCQPGFAESANAGSDGEERTRLLSEAMRSLSPEHVELLEGKYLEGRTVRDMAREQGKSEGRSNRRWPAPGRCCGRDT
jgi:RNA polymerase sigma-70 factor (ECF subfamily)